MLDPVEWASLRTPVLPLTSPSLPLLPPLLQLLLLLPPQLPLQQQL